LPALGAEARQAAVSDLLHMTVRANPADPRRMAQRAAAMALFSPYPGRREPKSILAESLEGVDRKLLYPAVQALLQNEDSVARGAVGKVYDELTDADLVELLPAITRAIERLAPSNEMFGDGVRLAGLDLLSRLHIREGMSLCISVMEPGRWGAGNRIPKCLDYLGRYGTHARAMLPQLRRARADLLNFAPHAQHAALVEKTISSIEASKALPTMLDLKEFMAKPSSHRKETKQ
jgi:hypothetical protein